MISSSRPWRVVAATVFAQLLFVIAYIKSERSLHFWDYAMYAHMAMDWFAQPGLDGFFGGLGQSLSQKYNLLFALPSYLSFSLFGPSRDIFIATNFVCFFLLHEAAIAFVLKRAFTLSWPSAIGWSLGLCWLTPLMWYPLLEGYPDNGAAAALVFGIGLSLSKTKTWKEALLIGLCFGLSVVLRRHFAYPVLASLLVLGGFDAADIVISHKSSWKHHLRSVALHYGIVVVGLLGIMVVLEPLYVKEMLTTNYQSLYVSYERPPIYVALFALSRVGFLVLIAAIAGFCVRSLKIKRDREKLLKVAALGPVWLFIWCLGPAQAGEHYLISILPVFIVVGLFSLYRSLPIKAVIGKVTLGHIGTVVLIGNALWAFCLSPFVLPTTQPALTLYSWPRPPWVRADYDEIVELAKYLGDTTNPQNKIVVAGSSFIFNQDLLRAAYTDALKTIAPALRFLQAPESDGEQEPPLSVYAMADIYVVATPAQYHLGEDGQHVVAGLVKQFPPDSETGPLFSKDPRQFHLMDGVTVDIWRRKKDWPPEQLHKELARLRKTADTPRKWITTETTGIVSYQDNPTQGELYLIRHGHRLGFTSLYFDTPVPNGQYRIKLLMNALPQCDNLSFSVRAETAAGKSVATRPSSPFQNIGPYYIPFIVEGKRDSQSYVTLTMTTTTNSECTVALWQLQLEHLMP